MLDTNGRKYFSNFFLFLAKRCDVLGLKPLHVSFVALFSGLLGALLFFFGFAYLSLIFLWLSGLCDVLDGELARFSNQKTQRGALLDIFFDRIVELAYILSFIKIASTFSLLVLTCSIVLSMTLFLSVGAMRDNQTQKAFYYQAGLMERTEGFIFFSLIILFENYATFLVYLFAFLIFVTIYQRLCEALKILK
jgi:CDP-diacylglycerol--glycerol-3-phosphate 3-phosphatidyltransferase